MKKWTTKDGIKMNVKDMTDSHLINAAKMVASMRGDVWEELFLSEIRKRKLSIKPIREVEEEEIDWSGFSDDFLWGN